MGFLGGKGLQQHNEGALFVALIYWEKSKWEVTVPTLNANTSFFKQLLQERVLPLRILCMTSKKREKWFEHVQHCNEVEGKHIPNADRVCSQQSHLPEIWQPSLKGDKPASVFFYFFYCVLRLDRTHTWGGMHGRCKNGATSPHLWASGGIQLVAPNQDYTV